MKRFAFIVLVAVLGVFSQPYDRTHAQSSDFRYAGVWRSENSSDIITLGPQFGGTGDCVVSSNGVFIFRGNYEFVKSSSNVLLHMWGTGDRGQTRDMNMRILVNDSDNPTSITLYSSSANKALGEGVPMRFTKGSLPDRSR